jgi:hypothetical protein
MAYSVVPDKSQVYTSENYKGVYLVVNEYNDNPFYRNWYHQDKDGIGHSGLDDINYIHDMIESEKWKLFKTLEKQWFEP